MCINPASNPSHAGGPMQTTLSIWQSLMMEPTWEPQIMDYSGGHAFLNVFKMSGSFLRSRRIKINK